MKIKKNVKEYTYSKKSWWSIIYILKKIMFNAQ